MTAAEKSLYMEIAEKLKTAPKTVLERVLGYVDGVLDDHSDFELTDDQKKSLLEIKQRPLTEHKSAELFFREMEEKYGV